MNKITTAGLTFVALSVALAGCSPSNEQSAADTTESTSSAAAAPTESADYPELESATLNQYIVDNDIAETPFADGDPGTPKIEFPIPDGWSSAGDDTPDWAFGAIKYDNPVDPEDPPAVIAIASKLTGDVDPAKILEYAPGQLDGLPGFEPIGEPEKDSLGGFEAIDYVGTYMWEGKKRIVGQQTIVIPGKDALFVLQLNGDALDGQQDVVIDAADIIAEQTKITLPS